LSALEYAHLKGVVHFDIKIENILLDEKIQNKVYLIDLGFNEFMGCESFFKLKT